MNIENRQCHLERQKHLTASEIIAVVNQLSDNPFCKEICSQTKMFNSFAFLYHSKKMNPETYLQFMEFTNNCRTSQEKNRLSEGNNREGEIMKIATEDVNFKGVEANGKNVVVCDEARLSCTPDFYCDELSEDQFNDIVQNANEFEDIRDIDNGKLLLFLTEPENRKYEHFRGRGIIETKLVMHNTIFDEAAELKSKVYQYVFQIQQQLLCTGLKWGLLCIHYKASSAKNSAIKKRAYVFLRLSPTIASELIKCCNEFFQIQPNDERVELNVNRIEFDDGKDQWEFRGDKLIDEFSNINEEIEGFAQRYIENHRKQNSIKNLKAIIKKNFEDQKIDSKKVQEDSGQVNVVYIKKTEPTKYENQSEIDDALIKLKADKKILESKNIGDVKSESSNRIIIKDKTEIDEIQLFEEGALSIDEVISSFCLKSETVDSECSREKMIAYILATGQESYTFKTSGYSQDEVTIEVKQGNPVLYNVKNLPKAIQSCNEKIQKLENAKVGDEKTPGKTLIKYEIE